MVQESWTYQWIKSQGRIEEARRILRQFGERFLGSPNAEQAARLAALSDPDRIERLLNRVVEVKGWDELLSEEPAEP